MKKVKPKKCAYSKCPFGGWFTPVRFTTEKTHSNYVCQSGYLKEHKKEVDKKVKEMRPVAKYNENKKALQDGINLLARRIDEMFGYKTCIDCDKPMLKQIHGAHLISVGSNTSTRYNLHNIHSALSQCNKFSPTHESGYKQGIIKRYGQDYLELIESLPMQYKELKLNHLEVAEKLKTVRLLIRTLHTYKFNSAIEARENLNKIIGIYK